MNEAGPCRDKILQNDIITEMDGIKVTNVNLSTLALGPVDSKLMIRIQRGRFDIILGRMISHRDVVLLS